MSNKKDAPTKTAPPPDELIQQGSALLEQQSFREAATVFRQLLDQDADSAPALRGLTFCLRRLKEFEESWKVLEAALAVYPEDAFLLREQAWWHYDQGKFAEAVDAFEKALQVQPEEESLWHGKIYCLRELDRDQEALEEIDRALLVLPMSTVILNERGWLRYHQKDYARAIEAFEKTLAVAPADSDAWQGKLLSLRRAGRFADADSEIARALELLPESVVIHNERGWLYYDQRQHEKAVEAFDQALRFEPGNEDAWRWKIISLRALRSYSEAQREIDRALEALPGNASILMERGWVHYEQKEYDAAAKVFADVIRQDASNETAHTLHVASLRLSRKLDEAVELLKSYLNKFKDSVGLLVQKGWVHLDLEETPAAEEVFQKAVSVPSDWSGPILGLVEVYSRSNRVREAIGLLEEWKAKTPSDLDIRDQLGWLHIRNNNLSSAAEEFQFILQVDENNVSGITGLGGIAFHREEYEKAEAKFRKALAAAPTEPIFYTNVAWTIARMEDPDRFPEAEELCRKALRLDSRLSNAYGCLGVIAFKQGELRQSEDCFLRSIAVNPRDGSYADLGALYVQLGRFEEAETQIKKALEYNAEDTQARIEMGNLFLQTDKPKDALREFRRATTIDPGNENACRGVALAQMRLNDAPGAEKTLRTALRQLDESKRWRLHLTLSNLLVTLGDKTRDQSFYEEALKEVNQAIRLHGHHADTYFQAGIIRYKLGDHRHALQNFEDCLEIDELHFEADRNVRRILKHLRQEQYRTRGSVYGAVALGATSMILLVLFVSDFFTGSKVTKDLLMFMVPILLGMIVVSFLLPWLVKLKLPGLEAELAQFKESVSAGPSGEVTGSMPSVSSGPR